MNRTTRHLICFAIVAVLMAALGLTAAAQDVLPMPQPAGEQGEIRVSPPTIKSPVNGEKFQLSTIMNWYHIGAPKYKVHLKDTATGIVYSYKFIAQDECVLYCAVGIEGTDILNDLRDGMNIEMTVIAKMPEGKIVSAPVNVTVEEVATPETEFIDNGETLNTDDSLRWSHNGSLNDKYRLILVDTKSGKKIVNELLENCTFQCLVKPLDFAAKPLVGGRAYTLFVKAIGLTGEKAVSAKLTVYGAYSTN